jgi:hypothetical protein
MKIVTTLAATFNFCDARIQTQIFEIPIQPVAFFHVATFTIHISIGSLFVQACCITESGRVVIDINRTKLVVGSIAALKWTGLARPFTRIDLRIA